MQTATEYKEALLHRLNGDARLAEVEAAFLTNHELPYAETDEFRVTLQNKINEATELGEYLRALEQFVVEMDVDGNV